MLKKNNFGLKHFLLCVIVLLSKLSFHSSSFIVFLFAFDTIASFARFQLTGHLGCLFSKRVEKC